MGAGVAVEGGVGMRSEDAAEARPNGARVGAGGRVLVLGAPRSGTTWVGEVLALADGTTYVHEPDNEKTSLLARCLKGHLPRFPFLGPADRDAEYGLLWRSAFGGALGPALARAPWLGALPGPRANEALVSRKESGVAARFPFRSFLARLAAIPAAPDAGPRVVKSVHAVLSPEWVAEAAGADRVVVVRRDPRAVVASLRRMGMPDAVRPSGLAPAVQRAAFGRVVVPVQEIGGPGTRNRGSPDGGRAEDASEEAARPDAPGRLEAMGLQLAAMHRILEDAAAGRPGWLLVSHEELCRDPVGGFRRLYEFAGLPWTGAVREGIERRNRPGEGFATARVAADEIGKWRKELSPEEAERVREAVREPLEAAGPGGRPAADPERPSAPDPAGGPVGAGGRR